jgi:hypothetical protein
MSFARKWMELHIIMLSKISQTQKDGVTNFPMYVESRFCLNKKHKGEKKVGGYNLETNLYLFLHVVYDNFYTIMAELSGCKGRKHIKIVHTIHLLFQIKSMKLSAGSLKVLKIFFKPLEKLTKINETNHQNHKLKRQHL